MIVAQTQDAVSRLVARGGLKSEILIGLDDSIRLCRGGEMGIADLYDDFGGKLTTGMLDAGFVDFAVDYLITSLASSDDLEAALGADPFAVDPMARHITGLHRLIDDRFSEFMQRRKPASAHHD